jgi:chemotaxis response regulator CheB
MPLLVRYHIGYTRPAQKLVRFRPVAHRDVVVIGVSSGGVEVLVKLVAAMPEDLQAALFIVLHVRPDRPSRLPAILNRAGQLPAEHAVDDEPVRRGRIYVAPLGIQLYVHRGRISVRRGPPDNSHVLQSIRYFARPHTITVRASSA